MVERSVARERVSKADHVYRALKRSIVDGGLPPGEPIDKDALCTQFRASRSPVTIAINRLAYEGLVRVEPQHGSFVAPVSPAEIVQWMRVRRALEAEGVAQAAHHADASLWPVLDRNLAYQRAAISVADFARFFELDVEFHHSIVAASGWTKFNDVLAEAQVHLERARRVIMPIPGHLDATWSEHAAILAALKRRSPEAATEAMRRHIDRVTLQFQAFASQRPDFFDAVPEPRAVLESS